LHNKGIAHGNISLRIFSIDNTRDPPLIKLNDLTEAHIGGDCLNYLTLSKFDLNYRAPEVLSGDKPTTKSDVWSLGILFHIMLFGEFPFHG